MLVPELERPILEIRRGALAALLAGVAATSAMGCDDQQVVKPPLRNTLFGHTDRLLDDNDDPDAGCFNTDGTNSTVLEGGTRDFRQSRRQSAGHPLNFPDDAGPLHGGSACSLKTKNWAGGYYKAAGVPATMGAWCQRYGFSDDCQTTRIPAGSTEPVDLQVSYFNAHALPVYRVTICNDTTTTTIDPKSNKEMSVIQPNGVGFACVNLNYLCPERTSLELPDGGENGKGGLPGIRTMPGDRATLSPDDLALQPIETSTIVVRVVPNMTLSRARCDPRAPGSQPGSCEQCEAVSVTMHYDVPPDGDKPAVIFAAYRGVGPTAELMDRIDLDFSFVEDVNEVIPNICNNCHGGVAYNPADPAHPTPEELEMQAQFLPINPRYALRDACELFNTLSALRGQPDSTPIPPAALMRTIPLTSNAAQILAMSPLPQRVNVETTSLTPGLPARFDISGDLQDAFVMNAHIRDLINPLPANFATLDALDRLYKPTSMTGVPIPVKRARAEVPEGWPDMPNSAANPATFYPLLAEHCNDSCHIALPGPLAFQDFADFKANYAEISYRDICVTYSMPQSPEAFNLFWSKSSSVGDPGHSLGDDADRFLKFLQDILGTNLPCEPPYLALSNATHHPEFVSPQSFEKKKQACIDALAAAGDMSQDINDPDPTKSDARVRGACGVICGVAVLSGCTDGDPQRFARSSGKNLGECNQIKQMFNKLLVVPSVTGETKCPFPPACAPP